ncbi:exported hypothetical protein [Candidatus Accumulibacter aalborgensis]|uniref:DUF4124 domain-containing protein n=1 Tax=Candidatus Accumulibacter aalborgensis TaxID=1860102 RepID=A0A1A8XN51_9PROT|nr:DUF4124 domain-containing protein [Candidatus Accumulibacter aalborgensis]SBT05373.1 exported hypothetical protein [Candidatus Accumulibacter aalborgensis]
MPRTVVSIILSSLLVFPLTAIAQAHYKCRTASGGTIVSDLPCPSETRQGQAAYNASQARQYSDPEATPAPGAADARMIDDTAAEAPGTSDLDKVKGLAVTPENWQTIFEAEQPVTRRTDADLQADSKTSPECKSARRSYDTEASSTPRNRAAIAATKRAMYSACGDE